MSAHEPDDAVAGIPLQAHVEELRRRCEAVAGLQGGSTHYLEEVSIFGKYAAERGLTLQGRRRSWAVLPMTRTTSIRSGSSLRRPPSSRSLGRTSLASW